MRTLEEQRITLKEKVSNCGRPLAPFDQTFRTAMEFLRNPQKLWASERMEDKKSVLRLVFADKLLYCKNEGFRTAQTTLPITLLGQLGDDSLKMVQAEGVEPSRAFAPRIFIPLQLSLPPSSVRGLDYTFVLLRISPKFRRCPSSLYTFPISRAWLGIAIAGFPEFEQFCIPSFPREHSILI
ncbi:MAG: hypothetical protein KAH96_07085 [Alphaproteobacteria bacterium]|nr:hypothetical protein [Alphaproteobacteria bacterium]